MVQRPSKKTKPFADLWKLIATLATTCSCRSIIGGTGLHVWDLKPGTDLRLVNQVREVVYFELQDQKLTVCSCHMSISSSTIPPYSSPEYQY